MFALTEARRMAANMDVQRFLIAFVGGLILAAIIAVVIYRILERGQ